MRVVMGYRRTVAPSPVGFAITKPVTEAKLPGHRIEEPSAFHGPCRQIDFSDQRRRPDKQRYRQKKERRDAMQQHDQRRKYHEQDVERQDIEIAELMCEADHTDDRRHRLLEEGLRIVPLQQERRIEPDGGLCQHGERNDGDQRLRGRRA